MTPHGITEAWHQSLGAHWPQAPVHHNYATGSDRVLGYDWTMADVQLMTKHHKLSDAATHNNAVRHHPLYLQSTEGLSVNLIYPNHLSIRPYIAVSSARPSADV